MYIFDNRFGINNYFLLKIIEKNNFFLYLFEVGVIYILVNILINVVFFVI